MSVGIGFHLGEGELQVDVGRTLWVQRRFQVCVGRSLSVLVEGGMGRTPGSCRRLW